MQGIRVSTIRTKHFWGHWLVRCFEALAFQTPWAPLMALHVLFGDVFLWLEATGRLGLPSLGRASNVHSSGRSLLSGEGCMDGALFCDCTHWAAPMTPVSPFHGLDIYIEYMQLGGVQPILSAPLAQPLRAAGPLHPSGIFRIFL